MFAIALALLLPANAQSLPAVDLSADMGASPIAESGLVVDTAASATDTEVRVTLHPPSGGAVEVLYDPSADWTQARDGSWSASIDADADAASTVLLRLSDRSGAYEGAARLDTETSPNAAGGLTIGVHPEADWLGDLIADILSPDFCAAYLNAHQFPSHAPSAAVWDYCADLLL